MGSLNVMPEYYNYFHLSTTTKSLNTAISYTGGAVAAFPAGFLVDWRGRRESIFWSCVITLIGAILQTSAVNIAMFIVGRFIIGMGMGVAATATPVYVSETAPPKYRAFALGLYYACWGVGTLIASGVCYRVSLHSFGVLLVVNCCIESICHKHLGLADSKLDSSRAQHCLYVCHSFCSRVSKMARGQRPS
jgi:MFS family permease